MACLINRVEPPCHRIREREHRQPRLFQEGKPTISVIAVNRIHLRDHGSLGRENALPVQECAHLMRFLGILRR